MRISPVHITHRTEYMGYLNINYIISTYHAKIDLVRYGHNLAVF